MPFCTLMFAGWVNLITGPLLCPTNRKLVPLVMFGNWLKLIDYPACSSQ